jgi:SHS2 domain-containing protein
MYETFEHTADLGLRIRASSLDQLFDEAAEALFSAVIEDLSTVEPKQRVDIQLQGDDRAFLLFDWLNELLYRFDTEHLLFGKFEVRLEDKVVGTLRVPCETAQTSQSSGPTAHGVCLLQGAAWGEPLDPSRHSLGHEVKAITYHGLRVEEQVNGWLAEVIVDI